MPGKISQPEAWADMTPFTGPLQSIPEGAPVRSIQPMWTAKIIRLGEDGGPELAGMRWNFYRDDPGRPGNMHARGETVDTVNRFSEAFAERRGILMVETFNVKKTLETDKTEQWVVRPKDRKPLALAVIWEEDEDDKGPFTAFCMITVDASPLLMPFEDRMPAILEQQDWAVWLGEEDAPFEDVKALLRTYDDKGNWEMSPQAPPAKKKSQKKPSPAPQGDLF
jgi:putative SOS response-associated peptidase YedK